MKTKTYRGFVTAAPPHLNPLQDPDRYAFSGAEETGSEAFACQFRVLAVPGCVSPQVFCEHVADQTPLPGKLELYPTDFRVGMFSYFHAATGRTESRKADEVTAMPPQELNPKTGPSQQHALQPKRIQPKPTSLEQEIF